MTFRVDPSLDVPPSRQIVEAVLDGVATGRYPAGTKLLSVRALAAEALVNPNTAQRAYRDLEMLGVVAGRNGRGVFVTDAGPGIARARREASTRDEFVRAAAVALRAGHSIESLVAALHGVADKSRNQEESEHASSQ